MSPPQSRRGSSRTAPPDRSSQADRPSRKSPQAACPHQKSRIDPSYLHPRILLCGLDSHKFRKGRYFSSCPLDCLSLSTPGSRRQSYHSIFLSHTSTDKAFVRRLRKDLMERGVGKAWVDEAE